MIREICYIKECMEILNISFDIRDGPRLASHDFNLIVHYVKIGQSME